MKHEKILNQLNLNDEEKEFIRHSDTSSTADINQTQVISSIYLAKKIEKSSENTIESNKTLAKSNEKYANRMAWLTAGLVFVGVVQIAIQLINLFCNNT